MKPFALSTRQFVALVGVHQIVCWGTLTYGVTVFGKGLADRVGVDVATLIGAYAIGLLCNGFCGPAATRWVMRGNAWVGGCIGLGLAMLACSVLAFAASWPLVLLGFALAGAAMALTQYDFAWMLVRLYHPHSPRQVVTGITLFGALASSIMWPVAHALNTHVGLTGGWLGLGALTVLIGGSCLWTVTHQTVARAESALGSETPVPAEKHSVVPSAQLYAIVFALTVLSVIGAGLAVNLPLVLQKAAAEPAVIPLVLSLFGVGQLLARLLDLMSSHRSGLDRTVLAAGLCSATSWTLLFAPQHFAVTAAAVLLMGASNGLLTIVRGATPQLAFQGDDFVRASSQLAFWGSVGRAVAPVSVAWALQSSRSLLPLALACIILLTFGIFALLKSARRWMVRQPR